MKLDDDLELKIGEKTYDFNSDNPAELLNLAFDVLDGKVVTEKEINGIDEETKQALKLGYKVAGIEESTKILEKIYVQAVKFVNGTINPSVDNFSLVLSDEVEINDLSANFGKIDK